jgi:histidyl-tRNA synthetase
MFGIKEPTADAEAIMMAVDYLNALGLNDLEVEINSLGCPNCRENFKNKLKEVLKPYFNELCEDCQNRYEKNPLRLLDCKVEDCQKIYSKPEIQEVIMSDFLCDECREHYDELKLYLEKMEVKYTENKLLVRGLDYYNRTVFEIKSNNLGSQNAVCGGGRYDSLVRNLGGEDTPAIGWAMGMERLNALLPEVKPEKLDGFIVLKENLMKGIKDTIISPIMELLFFSNFLYGYINIFNQKCFICQKITKYNKIDKVFYPPLILLLPYNKFCHEDCYIFHTNN